MVFPEAHEYSQSTPLWVGSRHELGKPVTSKTLEAVYASGEVFTSRSALAHLANDFPPWEAAYQQTQW
jgi:hypothetical protein